MGRALGLYLRHRHGIVGVPTTSQIEEMIELEGASVDERPTPGRILAACIGDHIVIRPGLAEDQRRWLLVHELVHYICGDNLGLYGCTEVSETVAREHRAEITTGYVFFGGDSPIEDALASADLARSADVPEECVAHWRALLKSQSPLSDMLTPVTEVPSRAWVLAGFAITWLLCLVSIGVHLLGG